MTNTTVAIIGAGRVGGSVGYLLAKSGYAITSVANRTLASAEKAAAFIKAGKATADAVRAAAAADIVLIATPDRSIKDVCEAIAAGAGLKSGSVVVHLSGAHTLDLLNAAKNVGAFRAVIHPLQSVPSREQGINNIPGSSFRIEADPEAKETAEALVRALGGTELVMPKWRSDSESAALYHAGAVAVSNYFVALVDYGLTFYQALGADKREALRAVLPLIQGTLRNIEALGIPEALTGPIARGDVDTVRGHLDAMRKKAPELLDLYQGLARQTIKVATDKGGITEDTAVELLEMMNKENR